MFLQASHQLIAPNVAQSKGDLFRASNFETLALFDRLYELSRFDKAIRRSGVEPSIASSQAFDIQSTTIEICPD